MRRIVAIVVTLLGVVFWPAVAEAHHVDHAQSSVTCALVNGTPTIQVKVAFREFEDFNKPARFDVYLNGSLVDSSQVTWPGANYDFPWSRAVTPGEYDVNFYVSWANYREHDQVVGHVTCPVPPPPSPTPTPPPTPPVVCNGVSYPPGTVCPPPPPPPCQTKCTPPPKKCVPTHAHMKVYPLRRAHGEVLFTLTGVKLRQVRHVTWSVRRPGHAWHRVGTSGRPWERLTHGGLTWHIYLWVESVWGYPQWGRHQVKATARIKTKCGMRTVARKLPYDNHDPEPRARRWE